MTTFFKNALNGTNNIIVCIPINYYTFFMHILLPTAVHFPPARAWSPDFPAHCCRKKCPSWKCSYTILFNIVVQFNPTGLIVYNFTRKNASKMNSKLSFPSYPFFHPHT